VNRTRLAIALACLAVLAGAGLCWQKARRAERQPTANLIDHGSEQPPPAVTPRFSKPDLGRLVGVGLSDWRTPISFYGKVIDQDGSPIEGAAVQLSWNDTSPEGTSKRFVLSDAKGQFSLTNVEGKILVVAVSKDGYFTSRIAQNSFEYASKAEPNYHVPDRQKPVLFRLAHKAGAEPLVYHKLRVPFGDGQPPPRVDLQTGALSDSGQFELHVEKAEMDVNSRKYDWKARIRMHGGGVIETKEPLPLPAPESGYQSEVTYDFAASDPQWTAGTEKYFTGCFGNPRKYFRAELYIAPDQSRSILKYWLNSSGSRILEHSDPGSITGAIPEPP
jgi:hypothetical protein